MSARDPIHPWRWRGLSVWIVAVTVGLLLMYGDIQHTRKESCVRQYHTIQAVAFEAFGGEQASARAKARLDRIYAITGAERCDIIHVPFYVWWD